MESTVTIDLRQVGRGLEIPLRQIQTTVELLDEGNTVPFITRYRKDQTGGLDEEQIREIQGRLAKLRLLADRKQTILRSIESQGKLTEKLAKQILAAAAPKRLEDLYLPFKPKKQTLATLARSRGLEPLAREILEAARLAPIWTPGQPISSAPTSTSPPPLMPCWAPAISLPNRSASRPSCADGSAKFCSEPVCWSAADCRSRRSPNQSACPSLAPMRLLRRPASEEIAGRRPKR